MRILAGDIGGTNTRLMVGEYVSGNLNILFEHSYNSQDYKGLLDIINDFYLQSDTLQSGNGQQSFDAACFAVAGPVNDQCVQITNLPWYLEASALSKTLGITKCSLINDFEAVGLSLDVLNVDDFVSIQSGEPVEKGVRLVVGAGTGFGVATQVWQGTQYITLPSEAGRTDFAPRDELQMKLLGHLKQQSSQVCVEKVLSGDGLVRIYEFICVKEHCEPDEEILNAKAKGDAASLISQRALVNDDSPEARALDCFVRIYAAQTANLALTTMATGGVYIAGGIAPKIQERMVDKLFTQVFCENIKMSYLLKKFPLHLVIHPNPGLMGAMHHAFQATV